MRLSQIVSLAVTLFALIASSAAAQTQDQTQPGYQNQAGPPTQTAPQMQPLPGRVQPQDWAPDAIRDVGRSASSRSEFSFDHSMLVLASKLDDQDADLRRVIAGIDGVSVHRYSFQNGASYDPEALDAVRREYHSAGWEHVSGGHHKDTGNSTDVWFHLENNAIRNLAFMVVGRDHINFVTVSGSISPLDLLHLAGHFGIPPIEGGIKIPNAAAQQAPTQQPGY